MEVRNVVTDKYDSIIIGSAEKASLSSFKDRYGDKISSLRITDICFEDYYLLHDLVSHKTKTINPDMFTIREAMKFAYLFSIYNDGLLNELYKQYPAKFIEYLNAFDNVFTVNYDSNIESAVEKAVYHIHGQFDKKGEAYNTDSFRNKLPDCPVKDLAVNEKFFYLYSNAISAHCGEYKQIFLNQHSSANNAVEKLVKVYLSDKKMRKEIDSWIYNGNKLVSNMGYCVQLKAVHPELSFSEDYHNEELGNMIGKLEILGLSPWNDLHIFESIDHSFIKKCLFYYLNESECNVIKRILPKLYANGNLVFESANKFWGDIYDK